VVSALSQNLEVLYFRQKVRDVRTFYYKNPLTSYQEAVAPWRPSSFNFFLPIGEYIKRDKTYQ